MDDLPLLSATAIASLVPMRDAIDALWAAYRTRAASIDRLHVPLSDGDLLIMAATDETAAETGSETGAAGVKIVLVSGTGRDRTGPAIQGVFVLFDTVRGAPIALLDGAALTRLRTPAVSAIATDVLARHDVTTLGIFGAGPQASGHVEAMRLARPSLVEVLVASRSDSSALLDALRATGIAARQASADEAAAADVVCTCTSSPLPVLASQLVRPGAHINAVGSYRPDRREIEGDLVRRSMVFVDDLLAARSEAGDLVMAQSEGGWSFEDVGGDLVSICRGEVARTGAQQVTLFKSVGLARQDLVVAVVAARRAGLFGAR